LQHFVEKPGILIPDLYFHNIKITNHKLNTRENQRYYLFFWAGSSLAHVAGLNPVGLAGSLPKSVTQLGTVADCMRELLTHALHSAKVINLPSHNAKSFKCNYRTEKGEKWLTYLIC
jgi:hypothetical protein